MSYLNDRIYDNGLSALDTEANKLSICSQEPANYTEANSTYILGAKTSFSIGSPAARTPSGRKVTTSAITDGAVSANGTASHYAIMDTGNSRLLAASSLNSSQVVSNGNSFAIPAFDIGFSAPA